MKPFPKLCNTIVTLIHYVPTWFCTLLQDGTATLCLDTSYKMLLQRCASRQVAQDTILIIHYSTVLLSGILLFFKAEEDAIYTYVYATEWIALLMNPLYCSGRHKQLWCNLYVCALHAEPEIHYNPEFLHRVTCKTTVCIHLQELAALAVFYASQVSILLMINCSSPSSPPTCTCAVH